MIRLGLPKENRWLDLAYGVRVEVPPLTTATWEAALATGRRLAAQAAIERGLLEDAGAAVADIPDLRDRDAIAGLSQMFFAQALAVHAIIAWEGVAGPDGTPAPVSEDAVKELIRTVPAVASDFVAAYTVPIAEAIAEGNGSGAAPAGTPAAAPHTAKPATTPTATPAGGNRKTRRAAARTTATRREPPTAG